MKQNYYNIEIMYSFAGRLERAIEVKRRENNTKRSHILTQLIFILARLSHVPIHIILFINIYI